ncbi:hypothetical protein [Arundinibacter roseus]|uniref:Uncharacterized protein n=1 Tax=Arundinibacter roseus TaxID=2070510 RepID=A0A4R4K3R0_9BACT|nr:hypothetical protein [Arundinibacter roseus]TDB61873.1 hypothetical protein EZE20_19225 [Arundinibacter roseus]
MAQMVKLEGTDLIFNLDHVITIQKATANASKKASLLFTLIEKKEVLWEFGSEDARDDAFDSFLTVKESAVF